MYKVHKAFTRSFIDLGLCYEGDLITIVHENSDLDPANDRPFVTLNLIPNVATSLGKDEFGCDESTGLYQVSIYAPSGDSVGQVLPLVDSILQFYKHNRKISEDDRTVVIINSGRNGGRNENGWWIIDITINFKADIQRV